MKKIVCIVAAILTVLSAAIGVIDLVNYKNGSNLVTACTRLENGEREKCEAKNEVMDLVIETTYQIEWMMAFGFASVFLLIMLSQLDLGAKKKK